MKTCVVSMAATCLLLAACESSPFGAADIEDASFMASVQGNLALNYEGLGYFSAFTPPSGVPRPASFTVFSSERLSGNGRVHHFILRKLGDGRPDVGRYAIGGGSGEVTFDGTYTRFTTTGSEAYSARSGEIEISVSTPDRVEGSFTFTGVRTCTGTPHQMSCSFQAGEPAGYEDAPTIEVTGTFSARPAPPMAIQIR